MIGVGSPRAWRKGIVLGRLLMWAVPALPAASQALIPLQILFYFILFYSCLGFLCFIHCHVELWAKLFSDTAFVQFSFTWLYFYTHQWDLRCWVKSHKKKEKSKLFLRILLFLIWLFKISDLIGFSFIPCCLWHYRTWINVLGFIASSILLLNCSLVYSERSDISMHTHTYLLVLPPSTE